MRRMTSAVIMAWAATALFAVAQARAEGPRAIDPPDEGQVINSTLAQYDLNKNGKLDATEKATLRDDIRNKVIPMRQAAMRQYDWNGNGVLETKERLAMKQGRDAQHARSEARALLEFDANHNGKLDPPEQEARRLKRETWLAQKKAETLQQFDANRNGLLDESEKATMRQMVEDARASAIAAFDKNGDGHLDPAERASANAADLEKSSARRAAAGNTGRIVAAVGGSVTAEGGAAKLSIPAGALVADSRVAITPGTNDGEVREGGRRVFASYQVHMTNGALQKPATLDLSYSDVASSVSSDNLVIGRWTGEAWQDLGGTVVAAAKRVNTPVMAAGRYALIERVSAPAGAAVASNLRVAPVSGQSYAAGANISFALGAAGGISVKVYDTAGRLIRTVKTRESMSQGQQVVRWDGRASDGRSVSNGLYIIGVDAPGNKLSKKVFFIR